LNNNELPRYEIEKIRTDTLIKKTDFDDLSIHFLIDVNRYTLNLIIHRYTHDMGAFIKVLALLAQ